MSKTKPVADEAPEAEAVPETIPTMTCSHCGREKPRPEVPGREQPDEFCPHCGKGEPLAD